MARSRQKWAHLLDIYGQIAEEQFGNGESHLVKTKFGDTQTHACGSPANPPLVFFHGVSTNSPMFGEWLIPAFSDKYYTIAIDTLGDMGRSLPRDGDTSNCPQNENEMAEWVQEVLSQLNIEKPVSIVGCSYGSFIATCFVQNFPLLVDKVVLLAPAGVVAPVKKSWLLRAITFAMLISVVPKVGMLAEWLQNCFFGYMVVDPSSLKNLKYPELRKATDAIGAAQLGVQPVAYDVEILTKITNKHPTLLVIGEEETVIDATLAVKVAQQANMTAKTYEKAGHMMFCEHPREAIIDEMHSFLDNTSPKT